jgi:hypothetical protein
VIAMVGMNHHLFQRIERVGFILDTAMGMHFHEVSRNLKCQRMNIGCNVVDIPTIRNI